VLKMMPLLHLVMVGLLGLIWTSWLSCGGNDHTSLLALVYNLGEHLDSYFVFLNLLLYNIVVLKNYWISINLPNWQNMQVDLIVSSSNIQIKPVRFLFIIIMISVFSRTSIQKWLAKFSDIFKNSSYTEVTSQIYFLKMKE
jgi:hypothetical protein